MLQRMAHFGFGASTSLSCLLVTTCLLLVSACSGGPAPTGAVPDAGSSLGGQAGETGSGGGAARTEFDLNLDFEYLQDGSATPAGWWVFIVDLEDGQPQILKEVTLDEVANAQLVRSFPNLLELGHHYAIAVTTGSPLHCPTYPEAAWYEELGVVVSNVTMERTYTYNEGYDARACDVFWQPTGLAPGSYVANDDGIEIVVADSGRLYTRSFSVTCQDMPVTCGSLVGPTACEPTGPLPGQTSWFMSKSGDYAHFEGNATVDAAAQTITFSGLSEVWSTSLTSCCKLNVERTLTRTGPVPFGYQSCP